MTALAGPRAADGPGLARRLGGRAAGLSRRSPTLAAGLAILALFAAVALLHPWLLPYDPTEVDASLILAPPGPRHWFGTDGNGMDVLSRVMYGAIYAFGIAIPVVIVGLGVGVPVGLFTGWQGGWTDEAFMRAMDALRVFPSIILALAVVAAAGPSLLNVVLVLGFLDAPVFARLVRAEVLGLRGGTFIEAAIAAGNPTVRILFVHLMPNAMRGAIAQSAVRAAWAVRVSATLAFLGVGIQPPTPEWGAMIRQGAEFMVSGEWWVAVFPGLALVGMVLGLNMLGDGISDLLDPRTRAARA